MKQIKNIEEALNLFEDASNNQAKATEIGDYNSANKHYKIIFKAVAFLKIHNEITLLDRYLKHNSPGVKLWSAYFLLPFEEKEATKVLTDIMNVNNIHSLTAETTLSEWRKGNLI